tara:strand:- start:228 stop:563 length:336 start_codon:yes stop_codon:yes gene_type:complete
MIIGSGYSRDVGGSQGTGYQGRAYDGKYGVPVATWLSWSTYQQDLFIQDFNRTSQQENYSEDSLQRLAFDYVDYVDNKKEEGQNLVQDLTQPASDIALGIGLLGLALLFRS